MSPLPPGPVNVLSPFGLTYRHYICMRLDPISFAFKLARKYGDIAFYRFFHHPVVLVNHPDLIREVLISQTDNFPKYDRIRDHLRQATGDGLLVVEGETWRKQRTSIQSVLRSDRMSFFAELTSTYARSMLDRWDQRDSVPIEEEMTLLMQAVMGKGFFGVELKPAERIAMAVRSYSDIFHHESRAFFNLPDWYPSRSKIEKRKSIRTLRQSLRDIITLRIRSGERREDLLDMLLYASGADAPVSRGIPEAAVIEAAMNQLLTMYVAGFHTTSVALAWLFYCVARYPDVQEQLRHEIDEVTYGHERAWECLPALTYADQVINESLRLYPPAWELFAHQCQVETELGGYRIPQGTLIVICPLVTQRDPRFFPRPDEFDPQRFAPEREKEIPPCAFLPFGLGPHHCIGKSLALMQMRLLLVHVLQRFELGLRHPGMKVRVVPRVSARPRGDIGLTVRRRQQPRIEAPPVARPISSS